MDTPRGDPATGRLEILVDQNPGPDESAYAYAGEPYYVATYMSFVEVVDSTTQVPSR
jgi:hypothetical protein